MRRHVIAALLAILSLGLLTAEQCGAPPDIEDSPEPFVQPAPPNTCNFRANDPHISTHSRQKGLIVIVAQASYGCINPLPQSHRLTLSLERRDDNGNWVTMTTQTCCPDPRLVEGGTKAPELTIPLRAPDGRTCIPGTWRLRVKADVVSAEGKPFTSQTLSNEREIPECPSS